MKMKKYFRQQGFTLVEVIVVVAIFVVLIFGLVAMLNAIFVNSNQQLLSLDSIDQARAVLSTFTNEVRNASTGSDGSYPLNQAADSQIIFFSNYGVKNGAIERIRYYISGNILYKGIVLPTGSPLSYNLSSETVKAIMTGISNTSGQLFFYYDGNYNGTTSALAQPVNLNSVRFIKMNLNVLNQITKNSTSTFAISAGSAIRSVKDNLGN
jgi:prepilin-type N-terminal cleavage/methylation domain-containing protein